MTEILLKIRTVKKSDYIPLSKHMASVFEEKCTEKDKDVLKTGESQISIPPYNKSLWIYISNLYPTIHIVFAILWS